MNAAELVQQGQLAHRAGRLDEAETHYKAALDADMRDFNAAHLLGTLLLQRQDFVHAESYLAYAFQLNNRVPQIPYLLALSCSAQGRPGDALINYERALFLKPDFAEALNNRGLIWLEANRPRQALEDFDRVLTFKQDAPQAHNNRGRALAKLGRLEGALTSFDRALSLFPNSADAHNNRGFALAGLTRNQDALAAFDRALQLNANSADANVGRGTVLESLGQHAEALASYDKALALDSNLAKAWIGRGAVLLTLGRAAEAAECVKRAGASTAKNAAANFNLGLTLQRMNRIEEALAIFDSVMETAPNLPYLRGARLNAKMQACNWQGYDQDRAEILLRVGKGERPIWPFQLLSLTADPDLHLTCAQNFTTATHAARPALAAGMRYNHAKIRVAYLSSDFTDHPVANLMVGNIEHHDRSRFETFGISLGAAGAGSQRKRLEAAFDRFLDGQQMSDQDVAQGIRDLEIDILVDLNGHTTGGRTDILVRRPAPVQVNYFGYPSTMGADFMDYIIVDRVLVPQGAEKYFSENIVALPDSYSANTPRPIAEETPSRRDSGLPEDGFVFCMFNNSFKITPDIFDVWMRLLEKVPGSVLWLLETNDAVTANLRREAEARGVAGSRLVFAPRVENARHLARHRLADLFVDTLYYNAHTTANDALWCGLPMITCQGTGFPARVAASLLSAIGMYDLITQSIPEYEALAIRLASDPALLRETKSTLMRNRDSTALFDCARTTRYLEAAYQQMWKQQQDGLAPASFDVPA